METSFIKAQEAVATIGVFDGVHEGHAALLARTVEEAKKTGSVVVVHTFDPHPASVLAPDRQPLLLTPTEEKIPLLHGLGAGIVKVIRFDRAMSELSPEDFVDRQLLPGVHLVHLVIGYDFALGKNRSGDAERLAAIGSSRGFSVSRVSATRRDGQVVSSTRIRQALARGNLDEVSRLSGRTYAARGLVVSGDGRGRELGFPTANLRLLPWKMMPPRGVYAVWAIVSDDSAVRAFPAILNYGVRPTFGGREPLAEVHIMGFSGELLGQILDVQFGALVRNEERFSGPEALATQIRKDISVARAILAARRPEQGPE